MLTSSAVLCPVCGGVAADFASGPGGRPAAQCRVCGALERHRFLALLVRGLPRDADSLGVTLDVAPSRFLSPLIRQLANERYLAIDFDPDADGRHVDVTASLTQVPLADDSVRLLVCYHVLEHVPDDAAAMAEMSRVLAPGALALVQVPWRAGATDEDPTAPPEERIRRFGQADHVRWYGDDFPDRLRAHGHHVRELTPDQVLPDSALALLGVVGDERSWICAPAADTLPTLDDVRRAVAGALSEVVMTALAGSVHSRGDADRARAGEAAARERAQMWRSRYEELKGRLPVRVMTAAARPFRRARTLG